MLTLGSLFDGIGGWQLAAVRAGIKPVWASEIDRFPAAVTKKHFPETVQLGDINNIDGAKIPPVDIICSGSPCQGLSNAGKRKGLQDERSGLFNRSVEVFYQMRTATAGRYPRFFVWENVPGAFSCNGGRDFQSVLREISETDIAIPQSGRWGGAEWLELNAAILPGASSMLSFGVYPREEKESFLSQILQKKEDVPIKYYLSAKACAGILRRAERINKPLPESLETALKRQAGFTDAPDGEEVSCEDTYTSQKVGIIIESSKSCTLAARDYKSPRNFVNYAGHPSLYDISHRNDGVRVLPDGKANTLSARMGTGGGNVLITVQKKPSIEVLNDQGGLIMNISKNITGTLRAQAGSHEPIIKQRNTVRKLTPLECERLQGLPDNWTLIEDKSCTDAARYKAIGNGMAQPCADFIMAQIAKYAAEEEEKHVSE